MLPTPPLYSATPTPIPPPNCTFILVGRSRDRHFLGVLRTIRTVYHQKYCNNATGRNRLLAPTSLQRWVSLLRSSRRQLQTLVLAIVASRGSGESRTWLTRSRESGDHRLPPLQHFLSPSHSPYHPPTSSFVFLPEVKNGSL